MLFVLTFAILREGIEDYMRYKHDLTTNSQIIEKVVSEGEVKQIKSKEIKVGDMIKINEGEELPADIIMVQSSDQGTRST